MSKWEDFTSGLGNVAMVFGGFVLGVVLMAGGKADTKVEADPEPAELSVMAQYVDIANGMSFHRIKTPGGWIVDAGSNASVYVPDPNHEWLKDN
jgi:hypothetical protein